MLTPLRVLYTHRTRMRAFNGERPSNRKSSFLVWNEIRRLRLNCIDSSARRLNINRAIAFNRTSRRPRFVLEFILSSIHSTRRTTMLFPLLFSTLLEPIQSTSIVANSLNGYSRYDLISCSRKLFSFFFLDCGTDVQSDRRKRKFRKISRRKFAINTYPSVSSELKVVISPKYLYATEEECSVEPVLERRISFFAHSSRRLWCTRVLERKWSRVLVRYSSRCISRNRDKWRIDPRK